MINKITSYLRNSGIVTLVGSPSSGVQIGDAIYPKGEDQEVQWRYGRCEED